MKVVASNLLVVACNLDITSLNGFVLCDLGRAIDSFLVFFNAAFCLLSMRRKPRGWGTGWRHIHRVRTASQFLRRLQIPCRLLIATAGATLDPCDRQSHNGCPCEKPCRLELRTTCELI
jgi:hypothetical protein